jgi:selenocysteine lyase/cysteine desulfurase
MDLASIRAEIPALRQVRPLNAGGVAPMPQVTSDTIAELYAKESASAGMGVGAKLWFDERVHELRAVLADWLHAKPAEIGMSRAVSESISLIAEGLDLQAGDRVILTDEEHPSGYLSWLNLRERRGIEVTWAHVTADHDAFMAELDSLADERTRAICLSHVTTERGFVLPVRRVARLARERGIVSIVDGAQAVGQLPVDLHDLGCDVYAFPAFKWCMGPYGVGALYVREERLDSLPVAGAGAGAAASFSFPPGAFSAHPTAARFEFGARPYPLYVAWLKSIEFLRSAASIDEVWARNQRLARELRMELTAIEGIELFSPDQGPCDTGIVTFGMRATTGTPLAEHLVGHHQVQCRRAHHDQGVRVCTHFFIDRPEIEALLDGIRGFRAQGSA